MGFYTSTYLILDADHPEKRIELSSIDPIVQSHERKQGYVNAEELIRFCINRKIKDFDADKMSEKSYIIESCFCTLDFDPSSSCSSSCSSSTVETFFSIRFKTNPKMQEQKNSSSSS